MSGLVKACILELSCLGWSRLVYLQACKDSQNSQQAEVDHLQSMVDELKREISVSDSFCLQNYANLE